MTEQNHTAHDNHAVLDVRVTNLEKVVSRVSEAVESIATSLSSLTRLEERHEYTKQAMERAFTSIGKQDERITKIELEMPSLKMVRGWVIAGVMGIMGILGVAILHLVLK